MTAALHPLRTFWAHPSRMMVALFWIGALLAIPLWAHFAESEIGWDLNVYRSAARSLHMGHDPYEDGIAVQRTFHAVHAADTVKAVPPYTYVYSPFTLPVVRWVSRLGAIPVQLIYWTLFAAGVLATIWVGLQFADADERPWALLLAPLALFLPGLQLFDVLFSGNIAYLLYGSILLCAWVGWRKGQWLGFYLMVLLASCCKAPMLTLLAIPIFSARGQVPGVITTGAIGTGVFVLQPHLWPTLFRHYLEAVDLQFQYNQDFGLSPAGVVANAFYYRIPYQRSSLFVYGLTALMVLGILTCLARRFRAGCLTKQQWIPVLLLGVILLNPRIKEYDVGPLTIVMALVLWRVSRQLGTPPKAIALSAVFLVAINLCAHQEWLLTQCLSLVFLFLAGAFTLYRQASLTGISRVSFTPPIPA